MAGGAEQESPLMQAVGVVLRADWIVRAKRAKFKGRAQDVCDTAADLDEAAQCPLSIRAAGVQQEAVAEIRQGIHALTDGTGWIPTLERDGRDQKMRDRMQQYVSRFCKFAV